MSALPYSEHTSRTRRRLFRHLPPAAVPVTIGDLRAGLAAARQPAEALARFRAAVLTRTGSPVCHPVSSGRAALLLILTALKQLSDRRRVIVPAYGCPTVVQSVLAAGLEPVFCDVSPRTLDFERDALRQLTSDGAAGSVLALVPVHLYGLAQDIGEIIEIGRRIGAFVVEDAAQAFGAAVDGQMVGTRGDAGLYSLGRGKCLPAGHGGLIVAQGQAAAAVDHLVRDSLGEHGGLDVQTWARVAAYGLATRPSGWWLVARSPFNPAAEGMNVAALPPIVPRRLSPVTAGIGTSMLERLDQVQATNRANAQALLRGLEALDFVTLPQPSVGAAPVYLRLPLVVSGRELADALFTRLQSAGIGVSRSYVRTLPDLYAGLVPADGAGYPGAELLATSLLTLPVHPWVEERDLERMVAVCRTLTRSRPR